VSIIENSDDFQLLRRFVEASSQEAFGRLVERHLDFVYSICRREVRDAALAEDVTQAVFLLLAQKASSLGGGTILTGWLFNTARFACRNAMRQEARRTATERKAMEEMMQGNHQDDIWQSVEPLLHDALAALGSKDREAVLLRYFENKSLKEVGQLLGISENTARMRVARAIEKLKVHLKKHGVAVSAAILAALMAEQAVQAAPATCAAAVAGMLANATGAGVSTAFAGGKAAVISKGVLKVMFLNKVKVTAVVVGLGLIGAGGVSALLTFAMEMPPVTAPSVAAPERLDLSTPVATVRSFVTALNRADFKAAVLCVEGAEPREALNASAQAMRRDKVNISIKALRLSSSDKGEALVQIDHIAVDYKGLPSSYLYYEDQVRLRRTGTNWHIAVGDFGSGHKELSRIATSLAHPLLPTKQMKTEWEAGCQINLLNLAMVARTYMLFYKGKAPLTAATFKQQLIANPMRPSHSRLMLPLQSARVPRISPTCTGIA
jgi:RNA polymerase sigma factor (sigma-70 family)